MWKEKEVHWLDTEYDMWPWTLTSLTHDLGLGCFKVKFRNSSISGIVGLIDVKWKGSELIYWDNCMTLPFDHTHDLDLGVSRSESEIAVSQEWGGQLTWNKKDVSHPFITMTLTSVTMVGWADVPDSDRGDFRHRRAIDIFSYICNCISWLLASYGVSFKYLGDIDHVMINATAPCPSPITMLLCIIVQWMLTQICSLLIYLHDLYHPVIVAPPAPILAASQDKWGILSPTRPCWTSLSKVLEGDVHERTPQIKGLLRE